MPKVEQSGLTPGQVQNFIDDGFVKIEHAFSTDLAKRCRDELWADIGLSPDRPDEWRQPVIRLAAKASLPFTEAANTPQLHKAYDQLVGSGRWLTPGVWELFRYGSPHRKARATMAGMWT